MALAKTKTAVSNGVGKKVKSAAPSTNGSSSPALPSAQDLSDQPGEVNYGSGKPDKSLYDGEQERIKVAIDALQAKLSAVKDKIGLAGKGGGANDKRATLRAELDSLRGQQSNNKTSRTRIIEQQKTIQEGIQKKIKDLNTARSRIPFRTVAEVDDRIKQLERQVESGTLKLADEKRALQEISQCKRNRRTVEAFQKDQEEIDKDRAAEEELRQQLADPEAIAISNRYNAIKAELDELKKESDEAYANRSKLMDERTALQAQLDTLYQQKRDSAQRFREANDRFYNKMNEDRARRAEKARAQRAADEEAKKKEIVERLREEASAPAFQAQIEDCQTLIDYFSGKSASPASLSSAPSSEKADLAGVPKLEIRQVDAPAEGLVVRKKKGEDEEAYFAGGGKGKKGKKGGAKSSPVSPSEPNANESAGGRLNVPLPTLSALLSLSIPPPTSPADIPRVVEDLKTKKTWFEANQARVTAENKAKAEAEIARLTGKSEAKVELPVQETEITPPAGGAERPPEPASTPLVTDIPDTTVPEDDVADKLEVVQEQEAEAEAEAEAECEKKEEDQ